MIVLTAGHHEKDSGAVNKELGLAENKLNKELVDLAIGRAKQIRPDIKIMSDDYSDTLSTVISKVKKVVTKDSVWIEIHFDSSSNSTASGSTSLISNNARERSKKIGARLSSIVSKVLEIKDRGVKSESQSNRGKLGMLSTAASSVLFEVGFISNFKDMEAYDEFKFWISEEIALILVEIHDGKL